MELWRENMNLKDGNVQNIKIRPLTIDDFGYVLKWSKDDTFCSANDWEQNRDEQELYKLSLTTFIDGQVGTDNDGGFLFLSPPLAVAN
jgi:hypothetical protein